MTQEIEYVYVTIGVDDMGRTCTFELRPFIKDSKEWIMALANYSDALTFIKEYGYTPIYIDKKLEGESEKKTIHFIPILQHIKTHRRHAR